jgi:hypothetical protein
MMPWILAHARRAAPKLATRSLIDGGCPALGRGTSGKVRAPAADERRKVRRVGCDVFAFMFSTYGSNNLNIPTRFVALTLGGHHVTMSIELPSLPSYALDCRSKLQ